MKVGEHRPVLVEEMVGAFVVDRTVGVAKQLRQRLPHYQSPFRRYRPDAAVDVPVPSPIRRHFPSRAGRPLRQMFPDGRVREFTVRVAQGEVERCRPFGLLRHTVVGGQQPDYRCGARFRLADAERLHPRRTTVKN